MGKFLRTAGGGEGDYCFVYRAGGPKNVGKKRILGKKKIWKKKMVKKNKGQKKLGNIFFLVIFFWGGVKKFREKKKKKKKKISDFSEILFGYSRHDPHQQLEKAE